MGQDWEQPHWTVGPGILREVAVSMSTGLHSSGGLTGATEANYKVAHSNGWQVGAGD